ncbi:hypothetical protein NUW58_g8032 [Xylaria curta]|uniref:Uncharacterized protein n=1 Tax=Xylaria curta TaxID=42375 RepID=A0ACC1NDF8_9PEZI|nr:hypothetical protein NUW58_g8032 [Xylaria curta]
MVRAALSHAEDDADFHLLPQDSRQHQSIEMTRKRTTGRGRGGAKSSIHQPMNMTPVPPVADTVQGWSAPSGQSDTSASGDTSFIPSHPNGPNFTSFKRRGNQARNGNSYTPQQTRRPTPTTHTHTYSHPRWVRT